jgi:hypothetical protein
MRKLRGNIPRETDSTDYSHSLLCTTGNADITLIFVYLRITYLDVYNQPLDRYIKLCKIGGFHGGDYEECRLLGYINPVRTSQETHYVSATEHSRLILCNI